MSNGAVNMLTPVGGIIANLIAFTSFFAFLDAVFQWIFSMIGLTDFGLIVRITTKKYMPDSFLFFYL